MPPTSGKDFVVQTAWTSSTSSASARSPPVMGRYYAMDRDNRWERVRESLRRSGSTARASSVPTPAKAVENSYADEVTDEFVVPVVIGDPADGTDLPQTIRLSSSTSVPTAPARSPARWLTRTLPASSASFFPLYLRLHDPVRRDHAERGGCLQAGESQRHLWRIHLQTGPDSSCALPRPRSTRTSPSSLTAAWRRYPRARTAR